jgi:O-antigen/teichoic acid export membrane protein
MVRSTDSTQGFLEEPAERGRRSSWPPRRRWANLRSHLADPLFRNAYALMMNTGATGVLGLFYWLLAAHLYDASDVGRASAAYAGMNLLAGVTALSFIGALTRFIPQAGTQTRALVARAYLVSAVGSVVLTILFLLWVGRLGASYAELGSPLAGLAFTISVAAWVIFTLQDAVLIGLRGATWVLAENAAFGVAKIALLVAVAAALPHLGIYVSWILPVFVAVPLINALIFRKLVPRHAMLTADIAPPTGRQIGRFLAGDYTGALALLATGNLVPVLVASRIDPRSTAYFYMAWTVGGVLALLGVNMATSLTVEGAFDASSLAANARAALRRMALILVPCALATALLASWGLGLFGPGYAAKGAPVLELLALGSLPAAVIEVYLGVLRALSRTSLVALVQGVRCVLVLGLTLALMIPMGTVGAGLAFLVSQVVVAFMIVPGLWRALTLDRKRTMRTAPEVTQPSMVPSDVASDGDVTVPLPAITRSSAAPGGTRAPDDVAPPLPAAVTWRPAVWPAWPAVAAVAVLAAAGCAMFFSFLRGTDLSQMNGLGLISVLPVGSLAGVVLLSLALIAGIALPRAHPALLGAALVALMVCLNGAAAVIEAQPRFATAYQIAGYVDYVAQTGHTAPGLQAYFSWPGFFAFIAALAGAAGQHDLIPLMRLWPVMIDLLCLLPLFLIMRNLRISWRARWLAGFFFTVGSWVGQDYFSPQALNYLLYLVFVAILTTWFTGVGPTGYPWLPSLARSSLYSWPSRLPGWLRPSRLYRRGSQRLEPGELPARSASTAQRALLLALLIGIYAVATTSHQLTPFYMLGACVVLILARRCVLVGLPLLLGVILVGWFSYAAVAFWSGHMADIFGGIGQIGGNVSTSVGGRVTGGDSLHELALVARAALAGLIVLLACLGIVRRRLRHLDDRILLALLYMPLPSIALQSYGGEIALRIYLFLLPAAAILAACFFFPSPESGRPGWRRLSALAVCAMVLPLTFLLARYGNETFERTPTGELAAMNYVYDHVGSGARVLWLSPDPETDVTPQMPWAYRDIAKVEFIPAKAPLDPASTARLASALRRYGPRTYLVTMDTQVSYLQETSGYAHDWGQRFRAAMNASPGVREVYSNGSAAVFTVKFPRGTAAHPPVITTAGPSLPTIVWTPVALAVLWLLIVVLAAREFTRLCAPGSARLLRLLTLVSWPLLVLALEFVIARFVAL